MGMYLPSRFLAMGIHVTVCKMVSQVDRNACGGQTCCSNASEVETRMFLEMICYVAASFSEPQLPPEVASLKHALLA
jgi:hypothetical protein